MDQEILVKAAGDQLDALQLIIKTAVGAAFLSGWAGLQMAEEISIFNMKLSRKDAFYIVAAVFLFTNISAIVYFLRISDIIGLVDKENAIKLITVIGTHKWAFNPYGFFGGSSFAIWYSSIGYGAIIVIWWLGLTTLALLREDKNKLDYKIVTVLFLCIGLTSMGAISLGFLALLSRLPDLSPVLRVSIENTIIPRNICTFFGIGLGGLIFKLAEMAQTRRVNTRNSTAQSATLANAPETPASPL